AAQRIRFGARRRHLRLLPPAVHDRLAVDEAPNVGIEAAELVLDLEKLSCVRDRGFDLEPIADDAGVCQQALDGAPIETRHTLGIEIGESSAVGLALAQDGGPAQAGLGALEHEE